MLKVLSGLVLSLSLLSATMPALADQYEECIAGCGESAVTTCNEKARLSAGNVQEEADMIAACEKARENCLKVCNDAEAQVQPPAMDQTEKQ